jgi:long-chain acyl-CoA synthetase
MAGYRNDPEKTAETIDEEGWLHTGDVGELDEGGYLRIVDRKKELIINSAGKNMSPANIEAKIKASSPLIGQACVIGDDRPYNVALIVLDPDAAPAFAAEHGIEDASPEALAANQAVIDEVEAGVERGNAGLARVEQVRKFELLPTDWQPGGEELTPTMKLKRRPIENRYATEIAALYAE